MRMKFMRTMWLKLTKKKKEIADGILKIEKQKFFFSR